MRWWQASAHDWVFCRLYSYYHHVDGGVHPYRFRLNKSVLWRWVLQTILIAGICFIAFALLDHWSPWNEAAGLLGSLVIIALPGRIFVASFRYAIELERQTSYPDADEIVRYVSLTREGILLNWLNGDDPSELTLICWDKIRKIELILTEHPRRIRPGEPSDDYMKHAERHFSELRQRYPQFPYQAARIYEDRLSLLITHRPAFQSQIPLPPGWTSEMIRGFLDELQKISGLTVARYSYGAEDRSEAYERLLRDLAIRV